MFNWISQTIAVTALNLRTIPQRLGSSGVAIVGIAGVVVVLVSVLSIAAGIHGGDARLGFAVARHRDAQRRRQRDDQRPRRARSRRHQAGAGHAPRRADAARVGRAVRHHRSAEEVHQHAGQRADARHRAGRRCRCATRSSIVEGRMFEFGTNEIIVGRGASGQFAGPHGRQRAAIGAEQLEGRRHVRGRRRRGRNGNLVRRRACCRAPTAAATPIRRCSCGSIRATASTRSATG